MDFDRYAVLTNANHEVYEFLSEGPNGIIKKIVNYRVISDNLFNLAFGDWDETEQRINYLVRTNNHDRDKVLVTVASTVVDFMKHHPDASLFAKGSTPGRTRLYQIGISDCWDEIGRFFEIEGFYKGYWEPFEKGKNYQAFTLEAKQKP
jgi:hypothetical protein